MRFFNFINDRFKTISSGWEREQTFLEDKKTTELKSNSDDNNIVTRVKRHLSHFEWRRRPVSGVGTDGGAVVDSGKKKKMV